MNCRLKKTRFKDEHGSYTWGFILMAKGDQLEFYAQSQAEQEKWIEAFKMSVIMLDLKDEFTTGELLGRGNFARVHLCHRKSNPSIKYALKTVDKASLKKCRKNIVSTCLRLLQLLSVLSNNSPFLFV